MERKIIFLGSALLAGVTIGVVITMKLNLFSPAVSQVVTTPSFEGSRMEDAVVNVASVAGKAVVSISTEHTEKVKGTGTKRFYFRSPFGTSPFGEEDPFRRYFEDFFGELPEREYKQRGLGSGVIIDSRGYILTNQHVIDEADKITVTLSDGRNFKAVIKGQDARSDLAIIQINAQNLPIAPLGDSDVVRIGQWVVAIGNPFAFAMQNPEPTVTVGVISALHRSLGKTLGRDRDYNDLIQTDAAINPGNSGGPLVNLKGEVVGVNVAIFSTSGGYQGVGFAIPINSAKKIIAKLIEGKKITYGWLGVTVQDLTDELAKYFGLPNKNGALIVGVLENGPAEKAGIKESDIIKEVDNKPVNNTRELLNIIGKAEVGLKVKVGLLRDKKEIFLEVVIAERPENIEEETTLAKELQGKWRGLDVEELTPDIASRLGVTDKKGVVVVDVESGSPADEAGIVAGDVILEINKQGVKNISDYHKITKVAQADALVKLSRGYVLIKKR